MKVLFLSWNFPPALGGIEYVACHLYYGLKERGVDIRLISRWDDQDIEAGGIFRSRLKGLPGYFMFSLYKGLSLFHQWNYDIILCGSIVSAPVAGILSLVFKKPYVILVHGSDVLYHNRVYQLFVKHLIRNADALYANSLNTKRLLINAACQEHRINVIYPGVDCAKFENIEKSVTNSMFQEYEGRQVILTVGRLIRRKGVLEFIENVMPKLAKRFPDIIYLVVGGDADQSLVHKERMTQIVQRRIDFLDLDKNVRLLGRISDEDLIRLYFRSDVFVLPCIDVPGDVEGFGIVFLEAALAGTPGVGTLVGGIPEAVDDQKTGILVTPDDYDGLFDAISTLIENDDLRKSMVEAGKARIYSRFCWPIVVKKYLASFRAVLAARRS